MVSESHGIYNQYISELEYYIKIVYCSGTLGSHMENWVFTINSLWSRATIATVKETIKGMSGAEQRLKTTNVVLQNTTDMVLQSSHTGRGIVNLKDEDTLERCGCTHSGLVLTLRHADDGHLVEGVVLLQEAWTLLPVKPKTANEIYRDRVDTGAPDYTTLSSQVKNMWGKYAVIDNWRYSTEVEVWKLAFPQFRRAFNVCPLAPPRSSDESTPVRVFHLDTDLVAGMQKRLSILMDTAAVAAVESSESKAVALESLVKEFVNLVSLKHIREVDALLEESVIVNNQRLACAYDMCWSDLQLSAWKMSRQ